MNASQQVMHLLISSLAGLVLGLLWLRFLLQFLRADFYNPVAQQVERLTRPLLQPLRQMLPKLGRVDAAALLLIVVIKLAELSFTVSILQQEALSLLQLLVLTVFALASQLLYFYNGALILLVIMSWVVAAGGYHPLYALVQEVTDPLCVPARRLLPAMGGLDFSIILVFLGLQVAEIVLEHSYAVVAAVVGL